MKSIGLAILGNILIFLLFAFAQWDIKPINWGEGTRVLCAFLMAAVILLSFMHSVWEDNDSV